MEFAREFVENLLFVAVSGLLFLIVVVGDGSDAMESRNIFGRRDRRYRRYGRDGVQEHLRASRPSLSQVWPRAQPLTSHARKASARETSASLREERPGHGWCHDRGEVLTLCLARFC